MSRTCHCRTRQRVPQGRHAQHRHRRRCNAAAKSMCWSPATTPAAPPQAAAQIAGVAKVLLADARAASPRAWPKTSPRRCWRSPRSYSTSCCFRPPPTARTSRRAWPPSSTSRQISEITKVDAPDTFERPIYAGNAIATVQIERRDQGHHRAHHRLRRRRGQRAAARAVESVAAVADTGKSRFVGARSPSSTVRN